MDLKLYSSDWDLNPEPFNQNYSGHNQAKAGRKKDFLLLARSKENPGNLSPSNIALNNIIEEILSKGYMHIREGD